VYKLFYGPYFTKYIKMKGSSWTAHIVCMENIRTVKMVFDTRPKVIREIEKAQTKMGGWCGLGYQGSVRDE
jgi:hypothetical protein